MRAPWMPSSEAIHLAEVLRNERAEVAAFRRNLAIVEARNSAALTYVRDKRAEMAAKRALDITEEDAALLPVLVAVEYLLLGRGEELT